MCDTHFQWEEICPTSQPIGTDVLVLRWSGMECFKKCEFDEPRHPAALTIADTLRLSIPEAFSAERIVMERGLSVGIVECGAVKLSTLWSCSL